MELRRDIPFLLPGAFLIRGRGKGKNFSCIGALRYTENRKTPEEKPTRNPGGNYGYTCSSLTTQTFRLGGYPWPIHRIRTPEPYRAAVWDESGAFQVKKAVLRGCFFVV